MHLYYDPILLKHLREKNYICTYTGYVSLSIHNIVEIFKQTTLLRGEGKGDNGGKEGKGCQGTCIKDTWTKPKGGWIEGGRWGWLGWGEVVGGKWRQLT